MTEKRARRSAKRVVIREVTEAASARHGEAAAAGAAAPFASDAETVSEAARRESSADGARDHGGSPIRRPAAGQAKLPPKRSLDEARPSTAGSRPSAQALEPPGPSPVGTTRRRRIVTLGGSHGLAARGGAPELADGVGQAPPVSSGVVSSGVVSSGALARAPLMAPVPMARALVVDDDPEIRRALARLLRPELDVHLAGSVAQAEALLERLDRVDVAFIDWELPDGTGEQILERLAHWPDAIRVLISAKVSSSESPLYNRALANLVLGKPLALSVIEALKRAALALPQD